MLQAAAATRPHALHGLQHALGQTHDPQERRHWLPTSHGCAQVVAAGWALPAVLAARAAVGLGEGVVLPSMSNLMATRVPTSWRATALGLVYAGFHSGECGPRAAAKAPIIIMIIYQCGLMHHPGNDLVLHDRRTTCGQT